MSVNQIAFFIGLFGSIHCIGMCGPLAFAMPVVTNKWWVIIGNKMLYNLGRVASYTLLGCLAGFIGRQLWLAGAQQGISFFCGMLIVMAGLSRMFKLQLYKTQAFYRLTSPVNKLLSFALKHSAGHFAVGIINGFLPCGFVYLALAGAVNTNSPASAAQYMFWFGMGTFPLMLAATISSGFIGATIRKRINKTMPYLMVCLGFWFIMRGLNLSIPYLSPAKIEAGATVCH